jgi:hypothetical protein
MIRVKEAAGEVDRSCAGSKSRGGERLLDGSMTLDIDEELVCSMALDIDGDLVCS